MLKRSSTLGITVGSLTALLLAAAPATAQQPDLVANSVDDSGVTGDWQNLLITGSVDVELENTGTAPTGAFALTLFEDRDGNGAFDPGTDLVLGTHNVTDVAAGATTTETVSVSGAVTFRENLIYAFADSGGDVAESNETNNVTNSGSDCQLEPTVGTFNPVLEWSWTGSSVQPNSLNVMMTPGVIDLTGDGVPEVVFGSTASTGGGFVEVGILRALDGADGSEVFSVTDPTLQISTTCSVAVGDIDGDGSPEILACDSSGQRLIAFEHDGTFKWRSPALEAINWGAPALADLDQDGTPEIIIGRQALDAMGNVLWTGAGGRGSQSNVGPISLVADVDLDGVPEVVAGNTVYSNVGTIEVSWAVSDGHNAIANFDADVDPEIVLVTAGRVYLLENDGTVAWGPVALPGGGAGGPPTIADYDGDGQPEIGVAGATRYTVFETDGSVRWAAVTQDGSSNRTGSSVFDFDGDGQAEVVYRDELKLRIYKGDDGTILFETPMSSCTWHEYVLVADVDADGNAEIVAVANNNCGFGPQRGVYVFKDATDGWVGTRPIWNQHSYHITNVNDDGTVPAVESDNWLSPAGSPLNNYRQNAFFGLSPLAAPDLTASYLRFDPFAAIPTATARIGNGGSLLVGTGLPVSFYQGDPNAGGTLIGTVPTSVALSPGDYEDVVLNLPAGFPFGALVCASADDSGGLTSTENECDETNNLHCAFSLLPVLNGRMTGGGSVFQASGTRFAHGFVLQCDANRGPNNLQINWAGGNRFHLTSLTSVLCYDDPNLDEGKPLAGFDTMEGTGVGEFNGVPGATITFKFTDNGEPGGADLAEFTIDDGVNPPIVVSNLLDKGNHQAHAQ